ncbi:hypothetical protein CLG96_07345 [Sphingomonas oleivorans]|uniref:Glycoside hydrolase family 5 domain-containing protein n=1 Tax=Sphingomonas oleivorans TaxID=1735121 RepID=A0A2T5G057_9SPHN|nr:cellulase family glycosylhydrolase [Sphingomonas oleivorans]PTQ12339.1 hypothetical protein CLG96_07345 [Sphingomonas oleivorans]
MLGVNLSGAEFGGGGGRHGSDYIYPSLHDLSFYHDRGIDLIRLPFRWERMQPQLGGPLDPTEVGRLKDFLANAAQLNMKVIVDLHNYGRYEGVTIGSGSVTPERFADFWQKLATELRGSPALAGYDLMNEPHNMGGADRWPKAAQAAVDAIRRVDGTQDIHVEGDGWSGAHSWQKYNANLRISDPANKIIYQAHQYFDKNSSGTYSGSYDNEGATPMTGVDRLKPFLDWLQATGSKGFIGEFAVPNNDPRWLTVLDNFIDALAANNISSTYWGAGPWWGAYPMALVGSGGQPNPQLDILLGNLHGGPIVPGGNMMLPPAPSAPPPPPAPAPDGSEIKGADKGDMLSGTDAANIIHGLGGNDSLRGHGGDDRLFGGDGKDKLNGDRGADRMEGGAGDDIYFIDNGGDLVIEVANAGRDRVETTISYTLPENIEELRLRSAGSISGTGNGLANRITGNGAANAIDGDAGDDILNGGGGADRLTGGAGHDIFDFDDPADSRGPGSDHIRDFTFDADRIDLSGIDADGKAGGNQPFRFIGSSAFTGHAGELNFVTRGPSGGALGQTMLQGDVNGDKIADFAIHLDGIVQPLHAADIIL